MILKLHSQNSSGALVTFLKAFYTIEDSFTLIVYYCPQHFKNEVGCDVFGYHEIHFFLFVVP